ncbi:hypothetical protein BCR39DRAFT_457800, partial [Naematelia encephala]
SNGSSVLECWQLATPFSISHDPGTSGSAALQLGNLANATYTVLPPRFEGGLHKAPYLQYVAFTSGLANITLPNSTDHVLVHGGAKGLIIAADYHDSNGHITTYPGNTSTIALQIPIANNTAPPHIVLHSGACSRNE